MEISDVRRRLGETIERAKRGAAARRARSDEAAREYAAFLEKTAVPLVRQIANVLKAQGYPFSVFTPSGNVRLASERHADDYIELSLDTNGEDSVVMGHTRRARGRRIIESERSVGRVGELTEEQLLAFLLKELEQLLEK
jgi:hypothetical protein